MKQYYILATIICAIFMASTVAFADTNIQIEVNGERLALDEVTGVPFIDDASRTQIPVKAILEPLGITVGWNGETHQVIASNDATECLIPIGLNHILVNGQMVVTDSSAVIKNGRTYIPIKKVAEAFGFKVSWDGYKRAVYIYDESHLAYYDKVLATSADLLAKAEADKAMAAKNEEAWYINKQGNLIIENDDYIFFVMDRLDYTANSDLYKQSKTSGKISKFKNAATSNGLYASDKYLINLDIWYYNIERIDIETGEITVLVSDVDTRPLSDSCILVDDWFYYSDLRKCKSTAPFVKTYNNAFSRVNINTGEIQVLGDIFAKNMRYWDGQLLYTIDSPFLEHHDDYYFIDLTTLEQSRVMTNEGHTHLPTTIVDNKMYLLRSYDGPIVFWTDISEDTYNLQTLDTVLENPCVNTDAFLVYKGDAYFIGDDAFADKYHLYRQNLTTGEYTDVLFPVGYNTHCMNIIDNKIYFYSLENVNYHIVGCHLYSMDLDGTNLQIVK